MMKQNVTFKTSLDYDADAHPAGEEIAEAIRASLATQGVIVNEIDNHEDYSWSIDLKVKEQSLWLQVGHIDDDPYDWLLAIRSDIGFLGKLFGKKDEEERNEIAEKLHTMFTKNNNFSEVRWHEGEYSDDYSTTP